MEPKGKVIWTSIFIFILLLCMTGAVLAEETPIGTYYKIDYKNKIISRVEPKTEVADFIANLNTSSSDIKIYKDKTKAEEVVEGQINTGMVLENTKTSDIYEISVIGDFNGDGKSTQLDLSYIIRKIVGIEEEIEKVKLESADLTGDGKVDQRDITKCIKYIVYGELDLDKEYIVVPDAGVEAGTITFEEPIWSEGKASINITTNTYYQVEYQVNRTDGTWIKANTVSDLQNNDIVYVRLTDGMHTGKCTSITISDTKEPEVTLIITSTTSSITVEANVEDSQSGMADDVTYKFSIKETSGPDTSYIEKQDTTENICEITELKQNTSYTIKVEVQDVTGNVGTKIETEITKTMPDASNVEGAIIFSDTNWVGERANIEVSTNTQYQIQYQVNTTEGTWTTAGEGISTVTVENLQYEDVVYARLFDGINSGNYTTCIAVDKEKPEITLSLTSTTSGIRAEVVAEDIQSGIPSDVTYKFSIKETSEADTGYIEKQNTTSNAFEITGLRQNTNYTIKVETQDIAGNIGEKVETIRTETITHLSTANIAFEYTPNGWTNQDVTVTVVLKKVTLKEGEKVQISTDGEDWRDGVSKTFESNGTIYTRVTDGTNIGSVAAAQVDNIDRIKPEILTTMTTANNVTFSAIDEASGIVGYKVTTTNTEPTSFETIENTKVLTDKIVTGLVQDKTYYIWVKDAAGNISVSKSITTGEVTQLSSSNVIFTYSPSNWTNGDVTVTATLNGVTLNPGEKMQVSTNGKDWMDGSRKIFEENGTMYVRITDGKNVGSSATAQVTNIDKNEPKAFEIGVTNVTTSGLEVSGVSTDEGSGIESYTYIIENAAGSKVIETTDQTATTVYISTKLEKGSKYIVYMIAYDKAGNYRQSNRVEIFI